MTFKYDTDVDVTVTENSNTLDGLKYTHPSYGTIRISRSGGGVDRLFGTDINHESVIRLTISQGSMSQDLGCNWLSDGEVITEIEMSPVQFSEAITNVNSGMVPCTLKTTQKYGTIKYKPFQSVVSHIEDEIGKQKAALQQEVRDLESKVGEILHQKGTLKKADKDAIASLVRSLSAKLNSELPFYLRSVDEALDKMKLDAKAEIDATIQHAITQTGMKALQDPEIVQKLLDNKSDE